MKTRMSNVFIGICCNTIAVCLITSFIIPAITVENNPPDVLITEPSQNDRFSWNAVIRYNIRVKDKEDGDSEFEEIKANEVLLEARYLADEASARKYIDKKRNEKENRGLTMIGRSDCFSCHASKSKLIGPSFEMISAKYKSGNGSVERLTKSIINGSSGTWGNAVMPAHPAIGASDAKEIVEWILKNGATPGLAYYPGLQGAFKTDQMPDTGAPMKVLVLTASYMDHGDADSLQNSRYGQHSITIKSID
jgi:cytochrome c